MSQREDPHDPSAPESPERRAAQRIQILGALRADVLISQPLHVTDISSGGFKVASEFPLQLDSIHEFRLVLDGTTLVVRGRIIHATVADLDGDGVRYHSGVAFEDLSDTARAIIAAFTRTLSARRAGERATSD